MILFGVVLVLHVTVAILLIAVVLLQTGRGGLADALGGASAQSLFGGGVNTVMTKVTTVGAALFMVTCLTLAKLSADRGRSVIEQPLMGMPAQGLPAALPFGVPEPSAVPEETPQATEPLPLPAESNVPHDAPLSSPTPTEPSP